MLLNLSLVMEFLKIIFTSFIFEKLLSYESLMTARDTTTSNNLYKQSNAALQGAMNEINNSSGVGSCDFFWSKFFAKDTPRFKSFSLIEYAFTNYFKCSSDRKIQLRGKELKYRKELLPNQYRKSLQSSMRLQEMCG